MPNMASTARRQRMISGLPRADTRMIRKQRTSRVDDRMGLNPVNLLSSRLHSKADFLWLKLGRQKEAQTTGIERHPWIDDQRGVDPSRVHAMNQLGGPGGCTNHDRQHSKSE